MTRELTLQDIYELMEYDNYEFQTQDVKTALLMLRKRMDKEAKELNTGEPVAWITPDGNGWRIRFEPPTNDVLLGWTELYSKDYVNQLLGEIEKLKAHLNAYQVAYGPKKNGVEK